MEDKQTSLLRPSWRSQHHGGGYMRYVTIGTWVVFVIYCCIFDTYIFIFYPAYLCVYIDEVKLWEWTKQAHRGGMEVVKGMITKLSLFYEHYNGVFLHSITHFSPFMASVDGLIGMEAEAMLKQLAGSLTEKWQHPYSQTWGHVWIRVSATLFRATHNCIQSSRATEIRIGVHWSYCEDGTGISL